MDVKINELPELTDSSGSHIVGYKGNDTVQIPTDAVVSKAQEIISDAYSATKAYTIGEYCIYNNSLYKCIANTSAGITPTNSTYWTNTSVSEELASNMRENAVNHRNVYRGKNLGTSVTSAQKAAIQAGTFDDLFIGDYWVINGATWVIADMDYFYNCGDTTFTKHHLVIVPNGKLYDAKMNDSDVTTGGYVGSKMYNENLNSAKATISAAFGDMVLSHREYLTNAVTDGYPSAGGWFDSTVELMNEIMVYGAYVHAPANNEVTTHTRYTVAKQQLSLFALNPKAINDRTTIWLRDVVSATDFAIVVGNSIAYHGGASNSIGVRPEFCIG